MPRHPALQSGRLDLLRRVHRRRSPPRRHRPTIPYAESMQRVRPDLGSHFDLVARLYQLQSSEYRRSVSVEILLILPP